MISKVKNIIFNYSQKSFDDVDLWLKDLKMNSSPDIKIFLIGNKADLEEKRVVNKNLAEKYKEDFDLDFFIETSAKTGMNAQEIFIQAAKVLFKDYNFYQNEKKNKNKSDNKKILEQNEQKNQRKCC